MRWLYVFLLVGIACSCLHAGQPTADAVLLAWQDMQAIAPEDRAYTRYLWLSDADVKQRHRTWSAAAGLLNGLSLSRRVVSPLLVLLPKDADGKPRIVVKPYTAMQPDDWGDAVLMRVNLLDYRQTAEQWDKLGNPDLEPFFHVWLYLPDEKKWTRALAPWLLEPLGVDPKEHATYRAALLGLVKATGYYTTPIVEARNFVWQSAIDFDRRAGYSSWLGVKDKKTFDRLVRLDYTLEPFREAVADSGVAVEARALERWGRGDGYWITYDQVNQRGQGNRNPLEQVDRKKFLFDAQEVFGRLDNGFWTTGLFDANGVRQDSAPDGVGYNHRSVTNDGKIHNYLTCLGCHDKQPGNGGLHPFSPFFRSLYAEPGPLAAAAKKRYQLADFAEQYLTPLDNWSNVDKLIYAAATFQANGLAPDQYATALVSTFNGYDAHLTLEAAAWEHGLKPEDFTTALQDALVRSGILDNTSAAFLAPEQRRSKVSRSAFAESYNRQELHMRAIPAWPPELKAKLRPWSK